MLQLVEGMDLAVHATIAPIYIVEERGRQHCVIKTGIEDTALPFVASCDYSNPAECGRPLLLCCFPKRIKVRWTLSFKIPFCSLFIHSGDGGLCDKDSVRQIIEVKDGMDHFSFCKLRP